MINNVVLVGRLTRDPELKKTQSGVSFVNFTVAVNRTYTDQSGERQADFISCVVWRAQADNLARYMRQGSLIGIEGRIQTRTYESEQGTRYITEIVANSIQFLETKSTQSQQQSSQSSKNNDDYYDVSQDIITDDDLPF